MDLFLDFCPLIPFTTCAFDCPFMNSAISSETANTCTGFAFEGATTTIDADDAFAFGDSPHKNADGAAFGDSPHKDADGTAFGDSPQS